MQESQKPRVSGDAGMICRNTINDIYKYHTINSICTVFTNHLQSPVVLQSSIFEENVYTSLAAKKKFMSSLFNDPE